MQNVMANEVATSWPGKEREGEGKINRSLEYLRKRFQLSVSTTGFHSIWEILESLDTRYYPEAFL